MEERRQTAAPWELMAQRVHTRHLIITLEYTRTSLGSVWPRRHPGGPHTGRATYESAKTRGRPGEACFGEQEGGSKHQREQHTARRPAERSPRQPESVTGTCSASQPALPGRPPTSAGSH